MQITLTDIAAILGMILGTAGFVLGVMNYLRDRSKIKVKLHWDWIMAGDPLTDSKKKWCVIIVTNEGRRPVYITHVLVKIPKGYEAGGLLLKEGMRGEKLGEGDRPAIFRMDQDGMEKYAKDWKRLKAEVLLSNGKSYHAKVNKKKVPSWATEYETKRKQMSFWKRLQSKRLKA